MLYVFCVYVYEDDRHKLKATALPLLIPTRTPLSTQSTPESLPPRQKTSSPDKPASLFSKQDQQASISPPASPTASKKSKLGSCHFP